MKIKLKQKIEHDYNDILIYSIVIYNFSIYHRKVDLLK